MPAQSSKRKRRKSTTAPRAVASTRREQRAQRTAEAARERQRAGRQLGREGERPAGPFGGVPVSEVAILGGLVAAVIGFAGSATVPLIIGLVICGLGVCEICAREHFAGYRSHTALLAGIPAVAIEVLLVAIVGEPRQRAWLLLVVVPVFGILFWLLRRRFLIARQTRVVRASRGVS